ncbi:MAG: hypothetical protein KJ706_10465 [Candidatus Omnitrophica bacterium]|nr:hypothetical protein [Candidatus Omnitrophota bacterium]MBU4590095.1 hypothetical protein [Candidatus Omnitrophota bacterium]
MDYSWGMAVKVSAKEITLMEYDYETDQDINVVYRIDPDVELYNIESMEDIAEGDTIEIDYVLDDKDKIAKVITLVVAAGEETDYLPEEDMEY